MNETSNCGIIYVAAGKKYFREALVSIQSVRKCMPSVSITLFTNVAEVCEKGLIDNIILRPDMPATYAAKILPLLESPYEKTIFMDTDTYMVEPCGDLFPLLDKFDLMVTHDSWRSSFKFETVPTAFADLSTGVVAYRKSPAVESFIRAWEVLHREKYSKLNPADQPSFRHLLFESNLRFLVLAPEYNIPTYQPFMIGGHTSPKILHERNPYLPKIAAKLKRFKQTHERPCIYGRVSPNLMLFYYVMKFRRVLHRWIFKR